MRAIPLVTAIVVVALTLAGCSSQTTGSESATNSSAPSASQGPQLDPAAIVGTWVVTDTGTAADGTSVTFATTPDGAGAVTITAECGTIDGAWAATAGGKFLGSVGTWTVSCDTTGQGGNEAGLSAQIVAWFTTATTYQVPTGSNTPTVTFANSANAQIATLVALQSATSSTKSQPASSPTSAPAPATESVSAPAQTSITTMTAIEGKWVQEGRPQVAPTPPFLEFAAAGTWSGSDGCNSTSGRWLLNFNGAILATSGPTTLIGCDGMVDLGRIVVQAQNIQLADSVLTLTNSTGKTLIRLVPEKAPASPSSSASGSANGSTVHSTDANTSASPSSQ